MSSHLKVVLPSVIVCLLDSLLLVVLALSSPWIHGAAASSGHLHVSPGNLEFQTTVVGRTTTLTFQIKNTGSGKLCLYHVISSKGQFTLTGPNTPVSLAPSKTAEYKVTFRPSNTGKTSALLEIVSSAQAMVSYTLSGKGEAPFARLQLCPASLNFGSVNLNSDSTKSVTLKNTGDISLKISGVTELGGGFAFSNISPGTSLAPNQRQTFQVSFHPRSSGTSSGKILIMSASLSSPTTLSLGGSGITPPPPAPPPTPPPPATPPPTNPSSLLPSPSSTPAPGQAAIHLGWAASLSPVVGYRVHRGVTKGGPYPNYTSDLVASLDYNDTSITTTATYFYVVTSIDSSGVESEYSNEVSATLNATSASSSGSSSPTNTSPATPSTPVTTPTPQTTPPSFQPSPPVIHLTWTPSESAVAGYRVYRSQAQGGPSLDYDAGPLDALSFDDTSVVSGSTYFYVVTSLDADGTESLYSNQAAVAVPAR